MKRRTLPAILVLAVALTACGKGKTESSSWEAIMKEEIQNNGVLKEEITKEVPKGGEEEKPAQENKEEAEAVFNAFGAC